MFNAKSVKDGFWIVKICRNEQNRTSDIEMLLPALSKSAFEKK